MSTVSLYLNFPRNTEEAFLFYQTVFGGEFIGGIHRMGEIPTEEGESAIAEEDKNLIMHITLKLLGDVVLMGTDAPESMGLKVNFGNNIYINLQPDTRAEAETIFTKLSEGGHVGMPLTDMFWGDYYGSFTDKFGVQWMVNCSEKKA